MVNRLSSVLCALTLFVCFGLAQDVVLTLESNGDLTYDSSADIYGFQFGHDGCASGAAGGADANAAGFMVSASSSTVLGFSMMGGSIPAGSGTLATGVDCSDITGILVSGAGGSQLSASLEVGGGDDGGTASCSGDEDVCLTLDGGDLTYSSSADIYGFQFGHDGCASGAAGGADANAAGFMVSASSSTVLGFSMMGGSIPAGSGTLATGVDCSDITGILVSGAGGSQLSASLEVGGGDDGGTASCSGDEDVCLTLDGGDLTYSS